MSWTQTGTANLVNGSAEVTLTGARWDGRYLSVGYGFQPIVAGLPLHEITAINVDTQTITIDPPWGGSTDPEATYKVVPMLGQLQAPAIALENASQALQDFGTSGLINELVVSGAGGIPLFSAKDGRVTINGTLDGLALPNDPTDRTFGAIKTFGSLGQDGYPIAIGSDVDLNTLYSPAIYRYNGGEGVAPENAPPFAQNGGIWTTEVKTRTGSLGVQEARRFSTTNTTASNNRTFERVLSTNGQSNWLERLTSQSILGPIGFVDGTPTRVMDSGSGPNGNWVQFAAKGGTASTSRSGLLVQWTYGTSLMATSEEAVGDIYSGSVEWTFPKPYATGNSFVMSFSTSPARWGGSAQSGNATKSTLRHFSSTSSDVETRILGLAIGFWEAP